MDEFIFINKNTYKLGCKFSRYLLGSWSKQKSYLFRPPYYFDTSGALISIFAIFFALFSS